jgi:glycosyltransferase involved in cell wall biosynthesis
MINKFLNKTDLISVEQMQLYHKLKDLLPEQKNKIIHLPNGLDYEYIRKAHLEYNFNSKENIILNVARIGTPEKNTEMLLEAFSKIKNIVKSSWKLVLVGPVEKEFHSYIEKFLKQNPELKDKIIFKGVIDDRTKLFEEYSRAKIFCLTSNFESFGFVFIEAAAFGDVIVSTDVGIARELITKGNGRIVKVSDVEALSNSLYEIMNDKFMSIYADKTYNICMSMFNWDDIIIKLNSYIIELFKNDKR